MIKKLHVITPDQLDAKNNYVGFTDLSEFGGSIRLGPSLGLVTFSKPLNLTGDIHAASGTNIKAYCGITAKGRIVVEGDIHADHIHAGIRIKASGNIRSNHALTSGTSITAKGSIRNSQGDIQAGTYIKASLSIYAKNQLRAGTYIKAGTSIQVGEYIQAGSYIEAGSTLEADQCIYAGLHIQAPTITTQQRIFAGLASRDYYAPKHQEIRANTIQGTIAYGTILQPA